MGLILTDEDSEQYVHEGAQFCPNPDCKSPDNLAANPTQFDYDCCWRAVECLKCGCRFTEHYSLQYISQGG